MAVHTATIESSHSIIVDEYYILCSIRKAIVLHISATIGIMALHPFIAKCWTETIPSSK